MVTPQQQAFLDMIAASEGTTRIKDSDDGYRAIVGGGTFQSYADHPRVLVSLPRLGIKSTAAGRYQLLSRYFDAYKKQLKLPDFSPASQDAIALQQVKECRALADIEAGNLKAAIAKCARIWASLPGAGYGQHEHKFDFLQTAFLKAGGRLA